MSPATPTAEVLLRVRGTVQGVGFRPFVHRVATALGLRGWVRNDCRGVLIRAVGSGEQVQRLEHALRAELPPAAHVLAIEEETPDAALPPASGAFAIIESDDVGSFEPSLPPDLALCAACRAELADPSNRRHRYPFINCTQCGPRYSIVENLPYDRPRTTMRRFHMCAACAAEYHDPASRRFHAEPNACGDCGPHVVLTDPHGHEIARNDEAILPAARRVLAGEIVAVLGLGGYHLMVDATNEVAVALLRRRKRRDEKPFAVMFADLAELADWAEISATDANVLTSAAAPIVILPRRPDTALATGVAPGNPWLGAFLASTPLHVLLLEAVGRPVVATSANLSDEPLCHDPTEAHQRLCGIADAFLDHDRPIARPVDDSVVRPAKSGPVLLRRARGYAPLPLPLPEKIPGHWLCVGAQMKNTVAVASADHVVVSPHLGDLSSVATAGVFERTIETLRDLDGGPFTAVACDKHPDYRSNRYAASTGLPRITVQHHLAHILACLLEHGHPADDVLGVAWDGTGYGEDGTVWGGEFITLRRNTAFRFGRLRPFRLPGGDAAVREPRRVALSLLHAAEDPRYDQIAHTFGFSPDDAKVLRIMLSRGLNAPLASSAGRLFDAVGALLGLGDRNHFEGQTPLAVEAAATSGFRSSIPSLLLPLRDVEDQSGAVCELDWRPLINATLAHTAAGTSRGAVAAAFHRALAQGITAVARRAGLGTVALSGGCFQNTLLLDLTVEALQEEKFTVLTHRELPPNDGNISAGQALGALWNLTSVTLP